MSLVNYWNQLVSMAMKALRYVVGPEQWIAVWVFLAEQLVQAEKKFKEENDGKGPFDKGRLKKEWVMAQLTAFLAPRIPQRYRWALPGIFYVIDSLIDERIAKINEELQHDWVEKLENGEQQAAWLFEPWLEVDLDGDGFIGDPAEGKRA